MFDLKDVPVNSRVRTAFGEGECVAHHTYKYTKGMDNVTEAMDQAVVFLDKPIPIGDSFGHIAFYYLTPRIDSIEVLCTPTDDEADQGIPCKEKNERGSNKS